MTKLRPIFIANNVQCPERSGFSRTLVGKIRRI
jgi:hypothetical protein